MYKEVVLISILTVLYTRAGIDFIISWVKFMESPPDTKIPNVVKVLAFIVWPAIWVADLILKFYMYRSWKKGE